jgi:hypothetical protein
MPELSLLTLEELNELTLDELNGLLLYTLHRNLASSPVMPTTMSPAYASYCLLVGS